MKLKTGLLLILHITCLMICALVLYNGGDIVNTIIISVAVELAGSVMYLVEDE